MKEKFPKKLDPLDKRLSDVGFKGGASKKNKKKKTNGHNTGC